MRALKKAIILAKAFESELLVANVIPAPSLLVEAQSGVTVPTGVSDYYAKQEAGAKNLLEETKSICKKYEVNGVRVQVVRGEKSTADEIIALANYRKVDLIVMGTRGLGGFKKLFLGSVSTGVVARASCDVLVVR